MRIAIVANEPSGDLLGAGLLRGLQQLAPEAQIEGVGGPQMALAGLDSLIPLEQLAVMGVVEVVRHLPQLLRIRRALLQRWLADPPDLFIGIDAPDFNLPLEKKLKAVGVGTVHYVCPSVWAWREGRVRTLRAAADRVLCIFPFEPPFLARHQIDARFVGHTLADAIPLHSSPALARRHLGIADDVPLLALLPGSRVSEVVALTQPFLETARRCQQQVSNLHLVVPLINRSVAEAFTAQLQQLPPLTNLHLQQSDARIALTAADLVLTASGTATLEALLLGKPMVVGYRLNPFTYFLVRTLGLVKTPYIAIPNLLAEEQIVPEFLQQQVTPENLAPPLLNWLHHPEQRELLRRQAAIIHEQLRCNSDLSAAAAVLELGSRKSAGCDPRSPS